MTGLGGCFMQLFSKMPVHRRFLFFIALIGISACAFLFQNCANKLSSSSSPVSSVDPAGSDANSKITTLTYDLVIAQRDLEVLEGESIQLEMRLHQVLQKDLDFEIEGLNSEEALGVKELKLAQGKSKTSLDIQLRSFVKLTAPREIRLSLISKVTDVKLVPTSTFTFVIKPRSQILKMKDVRVGTNHVCGLDIQSKLRCWGLGINYETIGTSLHTRKGMLGNGTTENTIFPELVSIDGSVVSYDVGLYHTCAITNSSRLFCWGNNASGQLGFPISRLDLLTPEEPFPEELFVEVRTGHRHTCAVTTGRQLLCWGDNRVGQLGREASTEPLSKFKVADAVRDFDLAAQVTCYVDTDRKILCSGANESGQLGDGSTTARASFADVGITLVDRLYLGAKTACVVRTDGQSLCWGSNLDGQLGFRSKSTFMLPTNFGTPGNTKHFALGDNHSCILTQTSRVACFGKTSEGQTGLVTENEMSEITSLPNINSKQVSAGNQVTCAINQDDFLQCWGQNYTAMIPYNYANASAFPSDVQIPTSNLKKVAYGSYHGCLLAEDGDLYCRGEGRSGQLGIGTLKDQNAFQKVTGLPKVKDFESGDDHVCAIDFEDSLWCWGKNTSGQLGTGTKLNSASPQKVNLNLIASVHLGSGHTCARTLNGDVFCWGANDQGQLGLGHTTAVSIPTLVNVPQTSFLVSGTLTVCALTKESRDYFCWGSNSGRFGNNTRANSNAPLKIDAIKQFHGLAIGKSQVCGIDPARDVYCWGSNSFNEIGNGISSAESKEFLTPQKVVGIANAVSIAAAYHHTCAHADGGQVFCWGYNKMGQMGNNSIHNQKSAQAVSSPSIDLTSLQAGRTNVCAVWSKSILRCWGAPRNRMLTPSQFALDPL